jgi:serine/threonine-protein kinase
VQAELQRILSSKVFARSERLSRFLRFVAQQALQGNTDTLKEYTLGVEVFDRRASYDPRLDPIVRVEARRLRTKLHEYYRTEGNADHVCIALPERGYSPVFSFRQAEAQRDQAPIEPAAIAVLPFLNMGSPENEYFSDGLTEELINTLAKIPNLRVVARTSVFQLKGKATDIRYIGAQLKVNMLLEGSVRREGGAVRVSAQLISVADGYHLWSDIFEREMKNVFGVQEEIASAIARALESRLGLESDYLRLKRHPANADAYNLYLQANYYLNLRTEFGFLRSLDCFQKAIGRDPSYALAYAGLAHAYSLSTRYHVLPPREAWPKAQAAAQKSIALDPSTAEAHTVLAFVKLHYEWDWCGAQREFRKALEINPSYALAHQWKTWTLAVVGQFDDAIASMREAGSFDPLSQNVKADLALAYYFARQFDRAREACKEVLNLQPGFYRPYHLMGLTHLAQGCYEQAASELQKAEVLSDGNHRVRSLSAYAQLMCGQSGDAQRMINDLADNSRQYVSAVDIALIYSALGDRSSVFEWLEKAYAAHDGELIWLGVDPLYDSVRNDPRFDSLLDRMKLAPVALMDRR